MINYSVDLWVSILPTKCVALALLSAPLNYKKFLLLVDDEKWHMKKSHPFWFMVESLVVCYIFAEHKTFPNNVLYISRIKSILVPLERDTHNDERY